MVGKQIWYLSNSGFTEDEPIEQPLSSQNLQELSQASGIDGSYAPPQTKSKNMRFLPQNKWVYIVVFIHVINSLDQSLKHPPSQPFSNEGYMDSTFQ